MTSKDIFIFKSNGNYLGFIRNDLVYSRDGIYLGWVEQMEKDQIVWDSEGKFRGLLLKRNGYCYILTRKFEMPPVSRTPKKTPSIQTPPDPPRNIPPISLPVDLEDAF